jgi:hypothetical protein
VLIVSPATTPAPPEQANNPSALPVQTPILTPPNSATNSGDVWDTMPTTISYNIGYSFQSGAILEGGYSGEINLALNIYSNQFSIAHTKGPYAYIGTPSLLSISGYIGSTYYKNLSNNDYLEGDSDYGGFTLAADILGKVGISGAIGRVVDSTNGSSIRKSFIDPVFNRPVYFGQTNVSFGVNAFANSIDGGLMYGQTKTRISNTWNLFKRRANQE